MSGIPTHAHNRVPEFFLRETLESGALDRLAILPCAIYCRRVIMGINSFVRFDY